MATQACCEALCNLKKITNQNKLDQQIIQSRFCSNFPTSPFFHTFSRLPAYFTLEPSSNYFGFVRGQIPSDWHEIGVVEVVTEHRHFD